MERHEILEMMGTLQLSGMRAAYDEIVATGVKRQQAFERVIGALLKAEIAEKQARSIRYQMGSAKLPLAKELADFAFEGTPINESWCGPCRRRVPRQPAQRHAHRRHRARFIMPISLCLIEPSTFCADRQTADAGDGGRRQRCLTSSLSRSPARITQGAPLQS